MQVNIILACRYKTVITYLMIETFYSVSISGEIKSNTALYFLYCITAVYSINIELI